MRPQAAADALGQDAEHLARGDAYAPVVVQREPRVLLAL